jgi:hypothetical protein
VRQVCLGSSDMKAWKGGTDYWLSDELATAATASTIAPSLLLPLFMQAFHAALRRGESFQSALSSASQQAVAARAAVAVGVDGYGSLSEAEKDFTSRWESFPVLTKQSHAPGLP